jgi:UDP-2-acetamido-2-deoxy-ribo-hexuluronate aminotransferase
MQSIDPRSQDETSRSLINSRIQAVLDHGQTIMGPEVAWPTTRARAIASLRPLAPRHWRSP